MVWAEKEMSEAGYEKAALERAAQKGFDYALCEHREEEIAEIMDQFYPGQISQIEGGDPATLSQKDSLMKVREIKSLLDAKATDPSAKAAR